MDTGAKSPRRVALCHTEESCPSETWPVMEALGARKAGLRLPAESSVIFSILWKAVPGSTAYSPAEPAPVNHRAIKKRRPDSGRLRYGKRESYFAALRASMASPTAFAVMETPEMASVLPSAFIAIFEGSPALTMAASTRFAWTNHSPFLAFIL